GYGRLLFLGRCRHLPKSETDAHLEPAHPAHRARTCPPDLLLRRVPVRLGSRCLTSCCAGPRTATRRPRAARTPSPPASGSNSPNVTSLRRRTEPPRRTQAQQCRDIRDATATLDAGQGKLGHP